MAAVNEGFEEDEFDGISHPTNDVLTDKTIDYSKAHKKPQVLAAFSGIWTI